MQKLRSILKRDTRVAKAICVLFPWTSSKSGALDRQGSRGQSVPNKTYSKILNNQSGQVIVEWVLLLFVAIMAATLISKGLVSRNQESPGVITGAWANINKSIGADIIE